MPSLAISWKGILFLGCPRTRLRWYSKGLRRYLTNCLR